MHCPNCRADNAPTTRFCTSCGAVLVEDAPGGGRRRVLRPWGLRRSAPQTVSPDFPASDVGPAGDRAGGRADYWLAGGVVALILVGGLLYPTLRSEAGASAGIGREMPTDGATVVALPAPTVVREKTLSAPALVEPTAKRTSIVPPRDAGSTVRRMGRARSVLAAPVVSSQTLQQAGSDERREPVVVAQQIPVGVVAPPPEPPLDRWRPLRDELARCEPLGLLQRAMCEQGARLAQCEGYWGQAALCPAGRTEYAQ